MELLPQKILSSALQPQKAGAEADWLAGWFGLSRMANSAQIADTSPASFLLSRKALENHRRRRRAVGCAASAARHAASAAIHYGWNLKTLSKNYEAFFSIYVHEIGFNMVINGKFLEDNFENLYFGKNNLWI